jgi:protein tyrosine phosphatase (PTP) superfamily phosphohydrolase (DUF442 family)
MKTGDMMIARTFWRPVPLFIKSVLLLLLTPPLFSAHADITDTTSERALPLLNKIEYSPSLTASGQPTAEALELAARSGYSRVIFLAFTNHQNALEHEDAIVKSLDMEFIHIPVEWEAPSLADFDAFAAAMRVPTQQRTLLHCEVNFRASVFGFLYQVIYQGVPMGEAIALMHAIWIPNEVWEDFIVRVLSVNGLDYQGM